MYIRNPNSNRFMVQLSVFLLNRIVFFAPPVPDSKSRGPLSGATGTQICLNYII